MSKIYTKQGDQGRTSLPDGRPIPKHAAVLEACGTIDELLATLGLARAAAPPPDDSGSAAAPPSRNDRILDRIQRELFQLNAEVADPNLSKRRGAIGPGCIAAIERDIDQLDATLSSLANFILPGGTEEAARLHLARTVCRRAERRLVALAGEATAPRSPQLVVYLNRLGDLLFVLARAANARSGRDDVPWRPN